ncbi:hypothetical protein SAMN04488061_2912 [Filomicrobium insigne]|uniref:Terminase small subunit n=1 Tax=Filomicrobium insigne TaxID=418854 RepID=A0A1H0SIK0_9HYPH|nr:hypothetical protein [Filomicrobium insigne]SDP41584.1 hypothetical protein SAMN04488061_2912 [Filomicrobium insigne]
MTKAKTPAKRVSQASRKKVSGEVPRVGHLDSLAGVLRELGCVYREARTGKLPLDKATKLAYVLKEMRAALEAITIERIEERLAELESMKIINGHANSGDQSATRKTFGAH